MPPVSGRKLDVGSTAGAKDEVVAIFGFGKNLLHVDMEGRRCDNRQMHS